MLINKDSFGKNFIWGVSTAAYQIEGASNRHSKGASIWDVFVKQKNRIFKNQHADMACDFYNRYARDICLMNNLHIRHHRFSIAWSRIMPAGTGKVNMDGIDFYNRVIDFSLEVGIRPWITLYHWDLPNELEKKGGWCNRDVVSWFGEYVHTCLRYFGDRVNDWMVLNEPMVFTGAGYFLGVHAPGKRGLHNFLAAAHHAALAQAAGGRIIKSYRRSYRVGTTFSCSHIEPYKNTDTDARAAVRVDAVLNRLFIEPLLGMGYPWKDMPVLKRIEKFMKADDEKNVVFKMDFLGLQNYTREIVTSAPLVPFVQAKIVKAKKRKVNITLMDWEVYPPAIYFILKKFSAYENAPPLMITENGAAFTDILFRGRVMDDDRLDYLKNHIAQVYRAKEEGVKVMGYFVWTFLDNFEWARGYEPRFGIVYVDFETQKRIVKSSGRWYAGFLSSKEYLYLDKD